MFIYGVVNASPDSLNTDSIARTPDEALVLMLERAKQTEHTLDEIVDDVAKHRIWFRPAGR